MSEAENTPEYRQRLREGRVAAPGVLNVYANANKVFPELSVEGITQRNTQHILNRPYVEYLEHLASQRGSDHPSTQAQSQTNQTSPSPRRPPPVPTRPTPRFDGPQVFIGRDCQLTTYGRSVMDQFYANVIRYCSSRHGISPEEWRDFLRIFYPTAETRFEQARSATLRYAGSGPIEVRKSLEAGDHAQEIFYQAFGQPYQLVTRAASRSGFENTMPLLGKEGFVFFITTDLCWDPRECLPGLNILLRHYQVPLYTQFGDIQPWQIPEPGHGRSNGRLQHQFNAAVEFMMADINGQNVANLGRLMNSAALADHTRNLNRFWRWD